MRSAWELYFMASKYFPALLTFVVAKRQLIHCYRVAFGFLLFRPTFLEIQWSDRKPICLKER